MRNKTEDNIPVQKDDDDFAFQVRFRNVGQGDTIIIEHIAETGEVRLGIIDCKSSEKGNPVVAYLNDLDLHSIKFTIAFFIISHPHSDHFSGAAELLKHIIKNNWPLENVASNLHIHNEYPQNPLSPQNTVRNIRTQLQALNKLRGHAGFIETMIGHSFKFDLTSEIEVRCFAPTTMEAGRYVDVSRYCYDRKDRPPSRAANLLSTVLAIVYKNKYILLTSDSERSIFKRLPMSLNKSLASRKLHAAQIPHHGSKRNFDEGFWKNIDKPPGANAVLSVGPNDPDHPSEKVIDFLEKHEYEVLRTDKSAQMAKGDHRLESRMAEISEWVDPGKLDTLVGMPT